MLRRRQINREPAGRSARLLRAAAEAARWPFERAAWAVERGLVWPLRERLAGWSPSTPGAGAAALGLIAVAAIVTGVLMIPSGDKAPKEPAATVARVASAPAEPQPQPTEPPQGPTLHGTLPSFGAGAGTDAPAGAAKKGTGDSEASAASGTEGEEGEAGTAAAPTSTGEAAAETSSVSAKPVPAGPAAMKVARRFSEAFVYYEIGARQKRAKTVFGETATAQLASALGERPPRLPADAKVPKARVLNLVAGPRAGRAYTVSVSLLRVGLTSELRLELSKKKGQWLVTDVRG